MLNESGDLPKEMSKKSFEGTACFFPATNNEI